MLNHFINIVLAFLPATRWFATKRFLFRLAKVTLGNHVSIGNHIKIYSQGDIKIESNVWLGRGAEFTVPSGVSVVIGNSVDIAPNVKFMCGSHDIASSSRRAGKGRADNIKIADGVWIGTEVVILGGVVIGPGSVIGAGAVILPGSYPPDVLLAGVPARIVKSFKDADKFK